MFSFIKIALSRPVTVLMFFTGIAIMGIISSLFLTKEFVPEISVPQLIISTVYPSAPPKEVRSQISIPLEDAFSSVAGLKNMKSISRSGVSTIELEFHWGSDMLLAGVNIREIIDRQFQTLPNEAQKPTVLQIDPNQQPLIVLGVFPTEKNISFARRMAGREIKTAIQQVQGVGSVITIGGEEEEIIISVDQKQLSLRELDISSLSNLISQSNINYPAGTFKQGTKEYLLKSQGKAQSINEISDFYITSQSDQQFQLKDIADIQFGNKEQISYFSANGKEGIGIIIRRRSGENPVRIAELLREKINELSISYANDLEFLVLEDASTTISSSIDGIFQSLLLGTFIAFFVLLLFTRRLRISSILVISIPFSIFFTLILMKLTNMSLNIMSLGGLALGIGMLVDNSVVVLENLDNKLDKKIFIVNNDFALFTHEMARSTLGSTLTSVIVFLPVLFLPGIIGALYKDLALTVSFSLLGSFLVSISIVPVLYRITYRKKRITKNKQNEGILLKLYKRSLKRILRQPYLIVLLLIFTLAPAFFLLKFIPFEFMPKIDNGEISMEITTPPGTTIEWIKNISNDIFDTLKLYEDIESVYFRAGAEKNDTFFLSDPDETREKIHVSISLKKNRVFTTEELIGFLRNRIIVNNCRVQISPPENTILSLLGLSSAGETILINLENIDQISGFKADISEKISNKIFISSQFNPEGRVPELHIFPDRESILRNKTQILQISSNIHASFQGLYSTTMDLAGEEYNVRIRLREQDRSSLAQLKTMTLINGDGTPVVLNELMDFEEKQEFASLLRINRKDSLLLNLNANPAHYEKAKIFIDKLTMDNKNISSIENSVFKENIGAIIFIFSVSIILLYLFLGAQFESFLEPVIILITLPLAFGGVVISLFLTGNSLNLNSILGILVLFGIVVNNSIVLRDSIKHSTENSEKSGLIIFRCAISRFRPILITTTTTLVALLPTALEFFGPNTQSSLSIAVIGGLFFSTFLTLYVIPVISVNKRVKNGKDFSFMVQPENNDLQPISGNHNPCCNRD